MEEKIVLENCRHLPLWRESGNIAHILKAFHGIAFQERFHLFFAENFHPLIFAGQTNAVMSGLSFVARLIGDGNNSKKTETSENSV